MRVETQVQHYRSEAFPVESLLKQTPKPAYKNCITYFGEYRFGLAIDDYVYLYDGELKGEYEEDTLTTQIRRGIKRKEDLGESTHREKADLAGALLLEDKLQSAENGDFVLWVLPPEPGSDEYGDHGYMYIGRISTRSQIGNSKRIDMTSYRINDKNLDHYNNAIGQLTGRALIYDKPEDFVAQPIVFKKFADTNVISILENTCGFYQDEHEEDIYRETLQYLKPQIHAFIGLAQEGRSINSMQKDFEGLEKYAVEVWELVGEKFRTKSYIDSDFADFRRLSFQAVVYRNEHRLLPPVAGSCGSTEKRETTNIFNKYSSFGESGQTTWDYHKGDCVLCETKNTDVGPCCICKVCEMKF